jgi:hypothetical protein
LLTYKNGPYNQGFFSARPGSSACLWTLPLCLDVPRGCAGWAATIPWLNKDNSLFKRVKAQNFQVDIYPGPSDVVYVSPARASNVRRRDIYAADLLRLFDAGLFQSVPFALNPRICRGGSWLPMPLRPNTSHHSMEVRWIGDITPFRVFVTAWLKPQQRRASQLSSITIYLECTFL